MNRTLFETVDGWQWRWDAPPAIAAAKLAELVGVDAEALAYRAIPGGDEIRPLCDFKAGDFTIKALPERAR